MVIMKARVVVFVLACLASGNGLGCSSGATPQAADGTAGDAGSGGMGGGLHSGGAGAGGNAVAGQTGGIIGSAGLGGSEAGGHSAGGSEVPGSGGASGNTGLGGSTPAVQPLVDTFCAAAKACCARDAWPADGLTDCASAAAYALNTTGVAAGRARLVGPAFAACVAAYQHAATTCNTGEVMTACSGVYVGLVAQGGVCSDARDCDQQKGPTVCFATATMVELPYHLMGVCRLAPLGALGAPCLASCRHGANCSTGFVTDDPAQITTLCREDDGLFCNEKHVCAAVAPTGGMCYFDDDCKATDYCAGATPDCQPRLTSGAACQFNASCPSGFSCVAGACAPKPLADDSTCASLPRYPAN